MNHRRGLDRHQTLLLPEQLEDYIAADNAVRFLDAFVASLDVRALGFAHAWCPTPARRLTIRLICSGGVPITVLEREKSFCTASRCSERGGGVVVAIVASRAPGR